MARTKKNPGELLIFGNPKKSRKRKVRNAGFGNHKPGCACAFCKRAAKLQSGELKPPPLPHQKKRNSKKNTPNRERKAARNRRSVTSAARRSKRNPDELQAATRLYRKFHGHDPKQVIARQVSTEVQKTYAVLGELEYLKVITPVGDEATFEFDGDGVKLASRPDGKQLYCIGGNQNILPLLEAGSREKDFIDLGECVEVQYMARKIHGKFEPTSYYHKFGERTGSNPQLMYAKLQKQLYFVGGEYFIDTKSPISPGIEN